MSLYAIEDAHLFHSYYTCYQDTYFIPDYKRLYRSSRDHKDFFIMWNENGLHKRTVRDGLGSSRIVILEDSPTDEPTKCNISCNDKFNRSRNYFSVRLF